MCVTNTKVTDLFDSYYVPIDEKLYELRLSDENEGIPIILRETEVFLRALLSEVHPNRILEIGTAHGYSAIFFALLMSQSDIVTIERDAAMHDKAFANIKEFHLEDRIRAIEGDAVSVIDDMIDAGTKPFDFVFLDASKSHYRDFFVKAEKLCAPGATVICDNILMDALLVENDNARGRRHRTSIKRMREFLDYVYERDDLDVSLLSSGDGLAIIKFI